MKKILLFLFISLITMSSFGQSIFKRGIKIGNDPDGSLVVVIDSIVSNGSDFLIYSGTVLLNDTASLSDVGFVKSDTSATLATKHDLINIEGGGGSTGKFYELTGISDKTSGAPESGDSSFTHSDFIGKHIEIWRESGLQRQNPTGVPNAEDGFRFNSNTGNIILRPILGYNEQIEIWATNTILWEGLSWEGQESDLLTYLKAYWAMDEVTGSLVNDSHTGNFDGTSTGTTEPYGKLGYTRSYTRTLSHYSTFGTAVGDMGTDDFSVCAWIYVPTLQSATCAILGCWGDYPYYYLMVNGSNYLQARINFTGSNVDITSNAAISASTWVHVALTVDRDGNATMYVNGVAQTDVEDVSAYSATAMNNNNNFSMGRPGDPIAGYYFHGYIDEIPLFQGVVLSPADITTIYNGGVGLTYPFSE